MFRALKTLGIVAAYSASILYAHAQAPANDNVANAQPLVGVSGSATAPNVGATAESGEPAPVAGNPAQASIWFIWTAPYTGWFDFSTLGSAQTNGGDLTAVMAIYASANGQPMFSDFNAVGRASGSPAIVHLDAVQGQTYFVQVDGTNDGGAFDEEGLIDLSWGPGRVGGGIGLVSPVITCSDQDNTIDWQSGDQLGFSLRNYDTVPSWYNAGGSADVPQVPLTITRTGGAVGRVEAMLSISAGTYTNVYSTNIIITNIITEAWLTDTNNKPITGSTNYTNYVGMIIDATLFLQNDDHGQLSYIPVFADAVGYYATNVTATAPAPITNEAQVLAMSPLIITNYGPSDPTNFPGPPQGVSLTLVGTPVINGTNATESTTNIANLGTNYILLTPAAIDGEDFESTNAVVTFDDFQSSTDYFVQITPRGALGVNFGADWPDANGNYILPDINGKVVLSLSEPMLDPQEDQSIQPPNLTSSANGELNILDANLNDSPFAYGNSYLPDQILFEENQVNSDGTPKGGFAVFNFERSVFRFNKDVGSNATIWVYRFGDASKTYSVSYAVDTRPDYYNTGTLNWDMWNLNPNADYAVPSNSVPVSPGWDFVSPLPAGQVVGTLTFPQASAGPQPITFPVINPNGAVEFDEDIYVHLFINCSDASSDNTFPQQDANEACQETPDFTHPMAFLGTQSDAHVIINFDNTARYPDNGVNIEPGGAVDRNYNPDGFTYSYPPLNPFPGANSTVRAIGLQANGEAVIGGDFSDFDTVPDNGVARADLNGEPDIAFSQNIGSGADGSVEALVVDTAGRIVLGGTFSSFNGMNESHIVRLQNSGAVDTTFKSGVGANGPIWAMATDSAGRIYIAGDFTSYNVTNCNHLARLNPDGSLDTTFNFGSGTDGTIKTIALDSSGNVIIGGSFSYVEGTNWNNVARLTSSGALDQTFDPGTGADGPVYCAVALPDGRMVIGGGFHNFNFVSRPHLAQLARNGWLDTSFVVGSGADDNVYSMSSQPDGRLLIGGSFTTFNGTRRVGLARLLPQGWVDTSFLDTSYNQFAGLVNHFYNTNAVAYDDPLAFSNERSVCYAMALQADGRLLIGGSFERVGGGYLRDDIHYRWNYARVIGAPTPGPMDGTTNDNDTGIGNYPGNITFTQTNYSGDARAGNLFLTITRTNGSLGPALLTLSTNTLPPGSGSATRTNFGLNPNFDVALYPPTQLLLPFSIPTSKYGWRWSDGEYGISSGMQPVVSGSAALIVTLKNDPNVFQDLFAGLSLVDLTGSDLITLGGAPIPFEPALGIPTAQLDIVNDNFHSGVFGFSTTNYPVIESGGTVTLTVVRTNGSQGSVTVNYATENGTTNGGFASPAVSGGSSPDFVAATGQLQFNAGETTKTIQVRVLDHSTAQPNKFFNVRLFNLTGQNGASFDTNYPYFGIPQVTTVTIVDDHFQPGHLEFNSSAYTVLKGGVAAIPVERSGGALGNISVEVVATNVAGSTAMPGQDYVTLITNLTWAGGDIAPKIAYVQTLQDSLVEGPKTLGLYLTNPVVQGNASSSSNSSVLGPPNTATLTIQDSDCAGTVNFIAPNYQLSLRAAAGVVTVVRTGGTVGTVTVGYSTTTSVGPGAVAATPGVDYTPVSGVLTFFPGVTAQSFSIPISQYHVTNELAGTNRVIGLVLSNPSGPGIPPAPNTTNCAGDTAASFPRTAVMTLLDPNLTLGPAGSVDTTTLNGTGFDSVVESLALQPNGAILAGGDFSEFDAFPFNSVGRIRADGAPDVGFQFNMLGANGTVWSVMSVPPTSSSENNGVLVGGDFLQLDGVNSEHLGRLNFDGSLDESFNPGSGPDNTVFAMAQALLPSPIAGGSPQTGYLIGGAFASYNGIPANGVARLTTAGQLDPTFNVGAGASGVGAIVRALAVQADGKIVVGGDFTAFNNGQHNHLVRLNADGSVDNTFMGTNSGPNDSVRAILVQPDGKIVIGGSFTNVSGVGLNHVARLNADGTVDSTFKVGVGVDNTVLALAEDTQARILLGGEFTHGGGVTRNRVTRLNSDGTVDPTINFGLGANGFVSSILLQTNDEIDLAGGFTSFDEIPENGFVRLYGGEQSGSGSIEFDRGAYGVEQGSNAVIAVRRIGGTEGTVSVSVFTTSSGTASNGLDYLATSNTLVFPTGETFGYLTVPVLSNPVIAGTTTVGLAEGNAVNVATGPQTAATLYITNVNTAVEFTSQSYRVAENVVGGVALIPVQRVGNAGNRFTVTAYTTGGTAVPGVNYTPVTNTLVFAPNVQTVYFAVPLINDTTMFQDATVGLQLTGPMGTNVILAQPTSATLTIASVYLSAGQVSFSSPTYTVDEGAGQALVTVNRANGVSGTVTVTLTTSDGTGTAGVNYGAVSTNITFGDGEFTKAVGIPVYQLKTASPNTTVNLALSNPQNGVTLVSPSTAVLTIQNNIQNFSFGSASYFVSEGGGTVTLTVLRNGPTNGTVSVNYVTYSPTNAYSTNGLAEPGVDYVPVTDPNGTVNRLTFVPGQTFQTIPITILQTNIVRGPALFYVYLTNNLPTDTTSFGTPDPAAVTIISDVTGFALATNAYVIGQNGGTLVVTVNRINANTGPVSVHYATSDDSATSGVDYVGTNGTLFFADGQGSTNITIPIINSQTVTTNRTFDISLSNPSANSYVVAPSNAVVTITNVLSGVAFKSLTYSACKSDVQATITVVRTGLTNNLVTVAYATTSGGSAVPGSHYVPTTGTLTFLPGQTTQTFNVVLINDNKLGPNRTVDLSLSSPTGAQLLSQSAAQLSIEQCTGSYVVSAGTAFISGNILPNTATIYSNETVTIAFGLRALAGTNTANLVGTLLNTNGVTNVVSPQTYGVLIPNGPAVVRQFTFEAIGTNGQNITAVMHLTDGASDLGFADFGFTIGGTTVTFSNSTRIVINDSQTPPTMASPYPSTITVGNVVGRLNKVTATLHGFSHTFASDVDVVLQGPGGSSILMSHAGYGENVNNVNLTFDQGAAEELPFNSPITSGTYQPTAYSQAPVSTMPALPQPGPGGPYTADLDPFTGTSATGAWNLWVIDDKALDSGVISGGWTLNLGIGTAVPENADLEVTVTTNSVAPTTNNIFSYTVGVTNYGPAGATNVVISDLLPANLLYASNSFNGVLNPDGSLTFNVASLAVGQGVGFKVYVTPTALGAATNVFVATADQPSINANNASTNVIYVGVPSADLGLAVSASASPVLLGQAINFQVTVTNFGPSVAAGTTLTYDVPAGLAVTGSSATLGVLATNGSTITWSIGAMNVGVAATMNISTLATAAGEPVSSAAVSSAVYDPAKANNFRQVRVEVDGGPSLSFGFNGGAFNLNWAGAPSNFWLEGATSLTPPAQWVQLTTPGVQTSYTLSGTNIYHFFRLRAVVQ